MPEADPGILEDLPLRLPDQEYLVEIARRSVTRQASSLRGKGRILLLHGEKDDRVQVTQAEGLSRILALTGVDHELVIVPGGNHSLTGTWGTLDEDSPPPEETASDREIREGTDRRLIAFFRDVLDVTPN